MTSLLEIDEPSIPQWVKKGETIPSNSKNDLQAHNPKLTSDQLLDAERLATSWLENRA